jgi:hypothetical protein
MEEEQQMSVVDRAWVLWMMAEALADDGRRWAGSRLGARDRGQSLVEYGFTIISVIAIAIMVWALLQGAMTAMAQRVVTAVNNVK